MAADEPRAGARQTVPPRRPFGRIDSVQLPKPPMWLQFVLSFGIAAILIVLLVRWVDTRGPNAQSIARVTNPKAIAAENQIARTLARQEQAPHLVPILASQTPRSAARAAVLAFQENQIAHDLNSAEGPIRSAYCNSAGGSPSRLVFQCDVITGGADEPVRWPFDAVATPASRTVAYCPVVYSAIAGIYVPVSPRCR